MEYLSARKPANTGEIPPMPYLITKFIPYIKPTVFDGEISAMRAVKEVE